MPVSISDTLTVNTSERYVLSIRINPDGFSFSGAIPSKSNSFFYQHISFDISKNYIESFKENFFKEECLSWQYKEVNIHCFTPHYLYVPEDLFDEKRQQELLDYTFFAPPQKSLTNKSLSQKGRILFGIETEVYEFLCRSYIKPNFIHHMLRPLDYWKMQNELSVGGQMYVLINKKTIDIACFKRGELTFINSFNYNHPDDIFYFIVCTWNQTGLDQLKDRLHIYGNTEYQKTLISKLKTYIQYASELELPTDAYLQINEIKEAPYDIILSVCE